MVRITVQVPGRTLQQGSCSRQISPGMMVQRHRYLNQALQEKPFPAHAFAPHILQGLVGVEEFSPVEQFNPTLVENRMHDAILS